MKGKLWYLKYECNAKNLIFYMYKCGKIYKFYEFLVNINTKTILMKHFSNYHLFLQR